MLLALQVPPVLLVMWVLLVLRVWVELLVQPERSVYPPPAFADHIGPIASGAISC